MYYQSEQSLIQKILCMHLLEEVHVPDLVCAFYVCKPVILCDVYLLYTSGNMALVTIVQPDVVVPNLV